MSASFTNTYQGQTVPLDMVYMDASAGTYTIEQVTLVCSDARAQIAAPARITATFDGNAFPLACADYLSPVTGDLTLDLDATGLTPGVSLFSFLLLSDHWQGLGRMMWSRAGFGVAGRLALPTAPLLYVSTYVLTTPASSSSPVLPVSAWH